MEYLIVLFSVINWQRAHNYNFEIVHRMWHTIFCGRKVHCAVQRLTCQQRDTMGHGGREGHLIWMTMLDVGWWWWWAPHRQWIIDAGHRLLAVPHSDHHQATSSSLASRAICGFNYASAQNNAKGGGRLLNGMQPGHCSCD